MGRLITEEAVYEYLSSKFDEFDISIFGNEFAGKILDGLGDIPTAYDVEKVVAELEKLKQHNKELSEGAYLEDDKSFYFCAYTNFAKAIDIVKRGGAG